MENCLIDEAAKDQVAKGNANDEETINVEAAKMGHCLLYEEGFSKLYNKLKPIVWIIKVTAEVRRHIKVSYFSGFCVDEGGILMTCAHEWSAWTGMVIMARKLDEDDFKHKVEVFEVNRKWDLCLLRIEELSGCHFGELETDGSLNEGETIFHIGHPQEFPASFLVGNVAYRCLRDVSLPTDGSIICAKYDSKQVLNKTPEYRVMGNVWNAKMFDSQEVKSSGYVKNLYASLPIIQCNGLTCGEGCSGGPVFNTRGNIVGMIVCEAGGYQIAIHVTALREFLENTIKTEKCPPPLPTDLGSKHISKKMKK